MSTYVFQFVLSSTIHVASRNHKNIVARRGVDERSESSYMAMPSQTAVTIHARAGRDPSALKKSVFYLAK